MDLVLFQSGIRSYGEKEAWYKKVVPNGMLPALALDGRIITESDVILQRLEGEFGPLHKSESRILPFRARPVPTAETSEAQVVTAAGMSDPAVVPLRKLERMVCTQRAHCAQRRVDAAAAAAIAATMRISGYGEGSPRHARWGWAAVLGLVRLALLPGAVRCGPRLSPGTSVPMVCL